MNLARWAIVIVLLGLLPGTAAAIELCGPGKRSHCVVDGDTFWWRGEKIRIEGIDAPELGQPRCAGEYALAETARDGLLDLLQQGGVRVSRHGPDRYGRTLASVTIGGRDVGEALIERGLALPYPGHKVEWCVRP